MPEENKPNGWNEYQLLVLSQLKEHHELLKELKQMVESRYVETRESIQKINTQIGSLEKIQDNVPEIFRRLNELEQFKTSTTQLLNIEKDAKNQHGLDTKWVIIAIISFLQIVALIVSHYL